MKGDDGQLYVSLNIVGKVALLDEVAIEGLGLSQSLLRYVVDHEPGTSH